MGFIWNVHRHPLGISLGVFFMGGKKEMQIIKDKKYETEKEIYNLKHISFNSNGTLSLVYEGGTHHNFNDKELKKILEFIRDKIK